MQFMVSDLHLVNKDHGCLKNMTIPRRDYLNLYKSIPTFTQWQWHFQFIFPHYIINGSTEGNYKPKIVPLPNIARKRAIIPIESLPLLINISDVFYLAD